MVKMMRWRPWPPLVTKKYQAKLVLRRIEGLPLEEDVHGGEGEARLIVEIKWKGQKPAFTSLRRKIVTNFTAERTVSRHKDGSGAGGGLGGVVDWEEEFSNLCSLSSYKGACLLPWEIAFTVLNVSSQRTKSKMSVLGIATVNLADFASTKEQEVESHIPVSLPGGAAQSQPTLTLCLRLLELRNAEESSDTIPRMGTPLSPRNGEASLAETEEVSALKASLRKVKILTDYVSARRTKKACREDEGSDGRCSGPNDAECTYPFDAHSLADVDEGIGDEKENFSFRKSFSYGTLASSNCVGGSCYSGLGIGEVDEDWVYYSNRRSNAGSSLAEESTSAYMEQSIIQASKLSILSWRKRKLSFRSPISKGEPLLKKAYGEEGGDDIDFYRRQLSSSDESFVPGCHEREENTAASQFSASEFGDDSFAVGCWERKEVASRDGRMKLCTDIFFASIDQRSEQAAGESACTALVAVIADWLQKNRDMMPIKSQFDSLIREGSLEWRNLCENEVYMERFPDKHFDLETILEAKIRQLSVISGKSFVGFFQPDGMDDGFEFLQGAMSFDSIWEEIGDAVLNCSASEPHVYIVSWNDHFFILKVEANACYIVDTLGERLFEGCNQAYILKFNKDTSIFRVQEETGLENKQDKKVVDSQSAVVESQNQEPEESTSETAKAESAENIVSKDELVCSGKEACKEYIKNFLAAIPLRELQVDVKKGLLVATPLHHRLQIEFHYTAPPSAELVVVQSPKYQALAQTTAQSSVV